MAPVLWVARGVGLGGAGLGGHRDVGAGALACVVVLAVSAGTAAAAMAAGATSTQTARLNWSAHGKKHTERDGIYAAASDGLARAYSRTLVDFATACLPTVRLTRTLTFL